MTNEKGSKTSAGERRQGDRRRNASVDFGIADRRRSERRESALAEDPSRAALARLRRPSR